ERVSPTLAVPVMVMATGQSGSYELVAVPGWGESTVTWSISPLLVGVVQRGLTSAITTGRGGRVRRCDAGSAPACGALRTRVNGRMVPPSARAGSKASVVATTRRFTDGMHPPGAA